MIPTCQFDAAGNCKRHRGNPHAGAEQRMHASDPGPMGQAWRQQMDDYHASIGALDLFAVTVVKPLAASEPCRGCLGKE